MKRDVAKPAKVALRERVADYISKNPGCTSEDVHRAHRAAAEPAQPVSDALYVLRRKGFIEEVYGESGARHLYLRGIAPAPKPPAERILCPFCRLINYFRKRGES